MGVLVPEGDKEEISGRKNNGIPGQLVTTDVGIAGEYFLKLGRCEEMMENSFPRKIFTKDNVPIVQHDGEQVL